jgi:tRNA(Ile)-lysidine synthase TilS/MesJ
VKVKDNSLILLCVSGGCDSMAMLHAFGDLKKTEKPELDIKVVNFNHKLRSESDEEVNA